MASTQALGFVSIPLNYFSPEHLLTLTRSVLGRHRWLVTSRMILISYSLTNSDQK